MIDKYWLVSRKATVRVIVRDGIVIEAAPLVRVFVGQPYWKLRDWFYRRFKPVAIECEWDYDKN